MWGTGCCTWTRDRSPGSSCRLDAGGVDGTLGVSAARLGKRPGSLATLPPTMGGSAMEPVIGHLKPTAGSIVTSSPAYAAMRRPDLSRRRIFQGRLK
jgi:hypothetical protein